MPLASLPAPIWTFVEAAKAGDIRNLVANFTADAVVRDRGREHRGPAIVHWGNWLFTQSRRLVFPLRVEVREGQTILSVVISDLDRTKPEYFEWEFTLSRQYISALSIQASNTVDLPQPVAAYVFAINTCDLDGSANFFAEGAVVIDHSREHRGTEAIRRWLAHDIIGNRVTLYVINAYPKNGDIVVTADTNVGSETTRSSELVDLTFSVADEKVTRLNIACSGPRS